MRLASSGVALGLLFWAAVARPVTVHANPVDARAFDVSDYFQVRRFTEVALSDDGRWLAYAVHSPAGGQDVEREFYLERLASSGDTGAVESLALPADAHCSGSGRALPARRKQRAKVARTRAAPAGPTAPFIQAWAS